MLRWCCPRCQCLTHSWTIWTASFVWVTATTWIRSNYRRKSSRCVECISSFFQRRFVALFATLKTVSICVCRCPFKCSLLLCTIIMSCVTNQVYLSSHSLSSTDRVFIYDGMVLTIINGGIPLRAKTFPISSKFDAIRLKDAEKSYGSALKASQVWHVESGVFIHFLVRFLHRSFYS